MAVAAEPLRVAMLGDSLTQGYGLPPGEGLVAQLQRWLDARGAGVRLINAGVSGDTTAGGAARADWTLDGGADALVVALGGNDILRGLDPAETRANLQAILSAAGERDVPVLLVGMAAPGNYGPEYKAAFEAIFPELAAAHDAALIPDMLAPLRARATEPDALRRLMQPDGLHPAAEGVALIVEALGPRIVALAETARNAGR